MVADCGGVCNRCSRNAPGMSRRHWAAGDARARRRWDGYSEQLYALRAGIQLIRAPGCDAALLVVV